MAFAQTDAAADKDYSCTYSHYCGAFAFAVDPAANNYYIVEVEVDFEFEGHKDCSSDFDDTVIAAAVVIVGHNHNPVSVVATVVGSIHY